jgi:putative transposase
VQRSHNGRPVFHDAEDRRTFLAALQMSAHATAVQLHAYALADDEIHLLATPGMARDLGRMMQALGRRYVSAHHRRHGGAGTLWDGRFRCAVVEPGATLLDVLALIDGQLASSDRTSQTLRTQGEAQVMLVDPPEYWSLGNTPFERQAAWRVRLAEGVPAETAADMLRAVLGGWPVGSAGFAAGLEVQAERPTRPRPRGRPRRGGT